MGPLLYRKTPEITNFVQFLPKKSAQFLPQSISGAGAHHPGSQAAIL